MKLRPLTVCCCVASLLMAGCQSTSVPTIKTKLSAIDLSIDASSYVVRAGETLETIAFRYNTTAQRLLALNPHAANGVFSGMHIRLQQTGENQQVAQPGIQLQPAAAADGRQAATVQTLPTDTPRALPITGIADNDYASPLAASVQDRDVPRIIEQPASTFIAEPGFPVEEVIDDEDFLLPTAQRSNDDYVDDYVEPWRWPLEGKLAREYDPARPNGKSIEIVGMPGQQVYATRNGVVDWVARSPDGVGKIVIVRHDDDYLSIYSNAQDLYVSAKDTVRQGQSIASLGANANHEPLLRFEISRDGNMLNPMDFLTPR